MATSRIDGLGKYPARGFRRRNCFRGQPESGAEDQALGLVNCESFAHRALQYP